MVKKNINILFGKIFYGVLFAALIPLLLFFWGSSLDKIKSVLLPTPELAVFALALLFLGAFLVFKAMLDLFFLGKGLPMNVFPPHKFVTKGIYAWLAHPIYFGAGMIAFGIALWFESPAGLFVVAPVFILAMVSLVGGYEHFSYVKIFGNAALRHRPILSLPPVGLFRRFLISSAIFISVATYLLMLIYLFDLNFDDNQPLFWLIIGLILLLSLNYPMIWRSLKKASEATANSRKDYMFFGGKFRIINHGLYSGLAGFIAVLIGGYIIGNNFAILIFSVCTILGGALFAQLRWGNPSLLRPYGFWGGFIGGAAGMLLIKLLFNVPIHQSMLAAALSMPLAQAMGRMRCLSQGCCHGIIASKNIGIRVWQNQSRVVTLSGLKGKAIHATQLYSILFNLWLALLLFAMWYSQKFGAPLIIGMYLILTGIERFTEDAYRGEKQTRMARGLQENQYIAIAALLIGIAISLLPFPALIPALGCWNLGLFITAGIGAVFAAFAMSMDFPKSKSRFSRLSG